VEWQSRKGDAGCFQRFVPKFSTQWYKASVDVTGRHLSGLLVLKTISDSTTRTVFTNEAGTTFFDFEFSPGTVKTNFALPQLNKGAVIKTLQNDLSLVLMKDLPAGELQTDKPRTRLKINRGKKTVYVYSDDSCSQLDRIEEEWGGKRRVEAKVFGQPGLAPDSIKIKHFNFAMEIDLRKLIQ